jgi:hypothetical protein
MSNQRPDPLYGLCKFQFANGKHCAMPSHPDYKGLCRNHGTAHRRTQYREDDLYKELASPAGDFITKIDINHVLGKLFALRPLGCALCSSSNSNVSPTYARPVCNSFVSPTSAKTGGYPHPKNVGAPTFFIFPQQFRVFR